MTVFRFFQRLATVFILTLFISSLFLVSAAQAKTFSDVQESDWFSAPVEHLVNQGIVDGSVDEYRPGDTVNRAEMAKLVVEAFGIDLVKPNKPTFQDVAEDAWYFVYVESAAALDVVSGYQNEQGQLTGLYGPADVITREQAVKMILLAAPFTSNTSCGPSFKDVPSTLWSYEYVETLYAWGVIDGYGEGDFGLGKSINRAEVARIISSALEPEIRPCGGFTIDRVSAPSGSTAKVCFNAPYRTGEASDPANYTIVDTTDGHELTIVSVDTSDTHSYCVTLTIDEQDELTNRYDITVENVMSFDGRELFVNQSSFTVFYTL